MHIDCEGMLATTEWRKLLCVDCGGMLDATEWRKHLCVTCGVIQVWQFVQQSHDVLASDTRVQVLSGEGMHLIHETCTTISIDVSTQCQLYVFQLIRAIILYGPNYKQFGDSTYLGASICWATYTTIWNVVSS